MKVYLINSLSLSLSVYLWVWAPSSLLLSSDSCLFSPTLSRDLIEGNHSDKKPPQSCGCTCVYMSAYVRASSIQPCHHLASVAPPIKMPCCSLDPCLALYLPKRAFCVPQKRATVSGREWEEALVIGAKGGGGLLLLFWTSGSTSLTSGELGCFQKCSTFHSSLLPSYLPQPPQWPTSSQTHHSDQCLNYFFDFFGLTFPNPTR